MLQALQWMQEESDELYDQIDERDAELTCHQQLINHNEVILPAATQREVAIQQQAVVIQ